MGSRILVVDDSPTIRNVVSDILERHGYEPQLASDGQDALDALSSGEVKADLVLVDFVMPRMNGYQFCRALRENAELATTPVVLMSAKADRIREQFVQQTGAFDAISKPFDSRALVAVVENALRRVNSNRASASRLPEFADEDTNSAAPSIAIEYETQRTDLGRVVAQKLASLVGEVLANDPRIEPHDLTEALTDRLADQALLDMIEAAGERADRGPILAGDLGIIPIGAIFQLLQVENQTGVLVCRNGVTEVRASFRSGLIDLVQSSGAGDEFRLGRFFVEEGVLTPVQIDEIMAKRLAAQEPKAPPPAAAEDAEAPLSRINVRGDALLASEAETIIAPASLIHGDGVEAPADSNGSAGDAAPAAPAERDPLASHSTVDDGDLRATSEKSDVERGSESVDLRRPLASDVHSRATLPGTPHHAPTVVIMNGTEPRAGTRPLGMSLLAAGKIVDSQLKTALTRQSSELLYEVLRWQKGRFELRREPQSELAESARLGLPVASVVMEGFRRVDEWRVLERTVGDFDAVIVRDEAAIASFDVSALPPKERGVLEAADGDRTVRQIVAASHMSSFDACRILAQLLEARVLRRRGG